jgi:hypothetical protein
MLIPKNCAKRGQNRTFAGLLEKHGQLYAASVVSRFDYQCFSLK